MKRATSGLCRRGGLRNARSRGGEGALTGREVLSSGTPVLGKGSPPCTPPGPEDSGGGVKCDRAFEPAHRPASLASPFPPRETMANDVFALLESFFFFFSATDVFPYPPLAQFQVSATTRRTPCAPGVASARFTTRRRLALLAGTHLRRSGSTTGASRPSGGRRREPEG